MGQVILEDVINDFLGILSLNNVLALSGAAVYIAISAVDMVANFFSLTFRGTLTNREPKTDKQEDNRYIEKENQEIKDIRTDELEHLKQPLMFDSFDPNDVLDEENEYDKMDTVDHKIYCISPSECVIQFEISKNDKNTYPSYDKEAISIPENPHGNEKPTNRSRIASFVCYLLGMLSFLFPTVSLSPLMSIITFITEVLSRKSLFFKNLLIFLIPITCTVEIFESVAFLFRGSIFLIQRFIFEQSLSLKFIVELVFHLLSILGLYELGSTKKMIFSILHLPTLILISIIYSIYSVLASSTLLFYVMTVVYSIPLFNIYVFTISNPGSLFKKIFYLISHSKMQRSNKDQSLYSDSYSFELSGLRRDVFAFVAEHN